MAQDFHGVSIGGTLAVPTIQNHTTQAIYGYVLVKHSTTVPHSVRDPVTKQWTTTTAYRHVAFTVST